MPLGGASNLLLLKHRCLRSGDVTPDVPRGCFTDSPTEEGALDSAAGRGGGISGPGTICRNRGGWRVENSSGSNELDVNTFFFSFFEKKYVGREKPL